MHDAASGSARTYLVHLGDQRRARTDSHGIINFSVSLTRALPRMLDDESRLVVFVNDELAPELGRGFLRDRDEVVVTRAPLTTRRRLAIDHAEVLRAARDAGADAILYPKGFLPLRRARSRARARQIVCLHDDIPFRQRSDRTLPRIRRLRAAYFSLLLRWTMRTADRRLFVSAFSRNQLVRRTGVERPDDVIIHQGITLPRHPVVPLRDRIPQAVVLGSHHPHKRIGPTIDLIGGDPVCAEAIERLVVVGPLPPEVQRRSPIEIVHRADAIATDELARLIGESRLLLFPSAYEGFGLPPIEAYVLGTPAVFRWTGAARELLDGVPGGFEVETAEAFGRAAAEALAVGDDELARLGEELRRRFDWDVVAQRVADVLASVEHVP